MTAPLNPIRSGARVALLSSAAAVALSLAAAGAAQAGNTPVPTNTGNWSGVSSITSTASSVSVQVNASRAYSEWSSFNLDAGNSFNVTGQTGKNWILVNKVTGGTGSNISGSVSANGQVWIIDPNGVTVNAGATFNVGGLVLSSAAWGAAERSNFLAGGTSWSFAGATGPIVMNGTINASGGVVALLGPSVTVGGTVSNGGHSQFLAVAAKDVSLSFADDGTYFTLDSVTVQKGADGGQVQLAAGSSVSADRIVVASAGASSAASIVVGGSLTATQARGDGADIVLTAADGTGADASPTAQTILSGGAVPSWSSGANQGGATLAGGGSLSAAGVSLAAGGDVSLGGDITATSLATLTSSTGAIVQTAGVISTPLLSGSAGTNANLTGANAVGALANFTASEGLSFTNATGFSAAGVNGGSSTTLTATTGDLILTGDVAGTSTTLAAGSGAITQTGGVITASGFSAAAGGGDLTLTGLNRISGPISLLQGTSVSFTNDQTTSVAASAIVTDATTGSVTLNVTTGDLTVTGALTAAQNVSLTAAGAVNANGLTATNGSLSLLGSSLTFGGQLQAGTDASLQTTGGDLVLTQSLTAGGTVTLTSSGAISQAAGAWISAGTLTGAAGTSATLDFANAVGALSNFTAGSGLDFTNATGFSVAGVNGGGFTNLTAQAGAITLAGDIGGPGAGWISFNSPVRLSTNATVTGSSVNFASTVDSASTGGSNSGYGATVDALSIVGDASFGGAVGGLAPLASLSVTGNTDLYGGSVITTGKQAYMGLVTLWGETTLRGPTVSFGSTVDAGTTWNSCGGYAETVDAGLSIFGDTSFGGAVGGLAPLTSLSVTGASISVGGSVTTSGAQAWNGAVTLTGDATLTSTGADVAFGGAVDGAHALTVNAPNGQVGFSGAVGATTALSSLSATGATISLGGPITTTGDLSLASGGLLTVGQALTSTGGDIGLSSTGDGLVLGADVAAAADHTVTLTAYGPITQTGGAITTGTLTGSSGDAVSLTGAGNAVGALSNFTALSGLSFTNGSGFSVSGVNGGSSTTLTAVSGDLHLTGDIAGTTTTLNAAGAISQDGGTITAGTLSGSAGRSAKLDFANAVGALSNFTAGSGFDFINATGFSAAGVNGGGFTNLTAQSGAITLAGDIGGAGAGWISFNAPVLLSTNATVTGSSVNFASTVDSASTGGSNSGYGATVDALSIVGDASFGGAVGGLAPLASLSVTGNTDLYGGSVITTGKQAYMGLVTLWRETTLRGPTVSFGSTVDAGTTWNSCGGYAETVDAGLSIFGDTSFGGAVGGLAPLTSLSVTGASISVGGSVTTSGAQAWNGALTLTADATLTSIGADVAFGGSVDGAHALTVNAPNGQVGFLGAVGATTALSSLSATGATISLGGPITTTGDLSLASGGLLTVGQALTSTGGDISLSSTNDALSLNADVTAAGHTVTLISAGAIDQNSGVITAATLTGSSAGATSLTGANRIATLGGFTTSGAGGDFALTDAQALSVTGPVTAGAGGYGSLSLTTTAGALTLNGDLTASANSGGTAGGTVALVSAGALDQAAGVITAQTVTGSSVGGATLTDANRFAAFSHFTNTGGGDVQVFDAQDLTVGAVTNLGTSSSIRFTSTGALAQSGGALASGQDLVLTAGTTLDLADSQTVVRDYIVTAEAFSGQALSPLFAPGRDFTVHALGDLTLDRSLTATRNLTLVDAEGSIDAHGFALQATSGDVSAQAGGALRLGAVAAAQGSASLTAGGDLRLSGDVTAPTVTLTAGGAIDQTGGAISATTLTGSAGASATLNDANAVASLTGFTAAKGLGFTNASGFSAGAVNGGTSTSLTASTGDLTLAGNVSGTAVSLTATTGAVDQAGGIVTASTLGGAAGTSATLDKANAVGSLTGFTAGQGLSFTNARGFSASGVNGGGSTTLTASTGDLTLSGNVTGTTTLLTAAAGAIEQTGGVITAGTLTGSAATSIQLTDANAVASLTNFTATGGLGFTDAAGFSASGVNGGTSTSLTALSGQLTLAGDVGGSAVTVTALGGGIDQTGGVITAGVLSGSSAGATTLNGANRIATLGGFTTYGAGADFSLTDAQSLTVAGPVTAGATAPGVAPGTAEGDLTLTATSGSLTLAGNLTANANAGLTAGGAVTLASAGGIDIAAPGSTLPGARVSGERAPAAAAGSNATVTGLDVSISSQTSATLGDLAATRDVAVSSATGSLTINSASAGGDLVLRAPGDITVNGALTASGAVSGTGAAAALYAAQPTSLTGAFDLGGSNVDVKAGGAIRVGGTTTAATDARFQAGGALSLGDVAAGQDLVAQGSSIAGGKLAATHGDVALLALAGDVRITSASAGNAVVISSTGVTSVSGALSAAGSGPGSGVNGGPADALAVGVLGQKISTAGDIVIAAADVSLGGPVSAVNGDVLLFARPNGAAPGDVYVGGADAAGGFHLDQAEIAMISAKSLDVFSGLTAASSRNVQVGAVALPSSLTTLRIYAGGPSSRVDVYGPITGGSASNFVVGDSLLNGAGTPSATVLALAKGWTPNVVRIEGTIGGLSDGQAFNQVSLSGQSIYIAPIEPGLDFETAVQTTRPEKLQAYRGALTYQIAAANLQLSASSPGVIYERNLQTNATTLSFGKGLSVGSLTITTIAAGDQGPHQIALFGTLAPKGVPLSGLAAALSLQFSSDPNSPAAVRFEPSPATADQYRFDGCVFGGGACFTNVPPFAVPPITISEQIGDIADPYAPTDEEPVTSSGGEITWPSVTHGEQPK